MPENYVSARPNALRMAITLQSPFDEGRAMAHETVTQSAELGAGPRSRRLLWMGAAVCTLLIGIVILILATRPGSARQTSSGTGAATSHASDSHSDALPVNTIRARKKTLERILLQPGYIKPWAQAELYAKASGYSKMIRRAPTPQLVSDLVAQRFTASPADGAACLAITAALSQSQAPETDIGSWVRAGDLLMEIATPERQQEIVEKETVVRQRQAELEAARMALATFEAMIEVAKAQKVQAEADIRKCDSEHTFRLKELKRLNELVKAGTVPQEIADEKQHQVNSALAAWESSKAKVLTVQAEMAVISSKLAAARAELMVKEALVQVATDEVRRAHILADYSRVYAPFDGIITYRGVDEGDFVQNATSGQSRRLMTVTAMDRVKVVVSVRAKDALWVRMGTEATVTVDARPGWQFTGRVARIDQLLDSKTLTMQAEIDLENPGRQLLPGMYANVAITLQTIPDARAIPAAALYSRKGHNYLMLVEDGIAHRQQVQIRYDDGKEIEVLKIIGDKQVPLNGSEELIVSNKGEISEGQHVKTSSLNAH